MIMRQKDKINAIKLSHVTEWLRLRNRTFDDLSSMQEIFCCCRIASGLHESRCGKFNAKVDKETLRRWEEEHGTVKEIEL